MNRRSFAFTGSYAFAGLGRALLVTAIVALLACSGGGSSSGTTTITNAKLHGTVYGGRWQPIIGSNILVYEAGLNPGNPPQQIGNAVTDYRGAWSVTTFSAEPSKGQLIYVVALDGDPGAGNNPKAALMSIAGVFGNADFHTTLNINALTTVASTSILRNYIAEVPCSGISDSTTASPIGVLSGANCPSIVGATGLNNQAAKLANLVNVVSGEASTSLTSAAGGSPQNIVLQKLDFLANVLADCLYSSGGTRTDDTTCGRLLRAGWNSNDSTLTLLSEMQAGSAPGYVAYLSFSSDGQHAYSINSSGGSPGVIAAYVVDGSTGSLSAVPGSPYASGVAGYQGPSAVTVSPNGHFVYMLSGGNILAFSVDNSTGALSPIIGSPFVASTTSYLGALVLSPDGKFAYASQANGFGIHEFSIDDVSGQLAQLPGSPFDFGSYVTSMVISPKGDYLYLGQTAPWGMSTLITLKIDSATGTLANFSEDYQTTSSYIYQFYGLNITPDGLLGIAYNAFDNTLWPFRIDPVIGKISASTDLVMSSSPHLQAYSSSMPITPNGKYMYVADIDTCTLWTFAVNGSVTQIGNSISEANPTYVGLPCNFYINLSADGRFLYISDSKPPSDTPIISIYGIGVATDTLMAALDLAKSQSSTIGTEIFAISPAPMIYSPVLSAAPADWNLDI